MDMNPIKNKSLAQAVVDEIIYQIKQGHLKPGEKLDTQRSLMKKLGVGMGVIREAIQSLQLANILDVKPGKGVYVSDISFESLMNPAQVKMPLASRSKKELIDFWNARMVIEIGAIHYIMDNITDKDLLELEDILNEMSKNLNENRMDLLGLKDLKFHNTLIRITGNQALVNMYKFVNELFFEDFGIKNVIKNYSERAMEEHTNILNAIRSKNEKLMYRAIKKHLDDSRIDEWGQLNP
jgi:GntR family transcriptional regulator, transcriptional repressor for pyruvate dehydrogenase complex